MHTLSILFCCVGFFMLYNTSRRAKLSAASIWERWLQSHPKKAKPFGGLLIIIGVAGLVTKDGIGAGLFTAAVMLMVAASYIVAIAPFYYIRLTHVAVLLLGGLFLELFIF